MKYFSKINLCQTKHKKSVNSTPLVEDLKPKPPLFFLFFFLLFIYFEKKSITIHTRAHTHTHTHTYIYISQPDPANLFTPKSLNIK